MKNFLKTLAAAAVGGACTGGAAVAATNDLAVIGQAAAVGAATTAAGLWVKKKPTIAAKGAWAIGLAAVGGAAQAVASGGAVDPASLATLALVGAVTGAIAGQGVKAPHQ